MAFAARWPAAPACCYLVRHGSLAVLVALFLLPTIWAVAGAPQHHRYRPLHRLAEPPRRPLLGTDALGRDVFSRLLSATRVAAEAFVIVVVIGGAVERCRHPPAGWAAFLDGRLAGPRWCRLPTVLVAIVIVALTRPTLTNAMVAVGIAAIPDFARVSRGVAIQLCDREFIQAARGWAPARSASRGARVATVGPLIIISARRCPAVLGEAALSSSGWRAAAGIVLRLDAEEAQSYLSIQPWLAIVAGPRCRWTSA
jgi:peptide/nickel transport system permease protein